MSFKIFNFKTMMFFVVLGISIFLYKYLVSTKPEAKPQTVEEKTFYVNVINTKRNNYSPTSDAYGKITSSRSGDLRFGVSGKVHQSVGLHFLMILFFHKHLKLVSNYFFLHL